MKHWTGTIRAALTYWREAEPYLSVTTTAKALTALSELERMAGEPVAWKHDCAALLANDVELWIDNCPHCGRPRAAPPAQQPQAEPLTDEQRLGWFAWRVKDLEQKLTQALKQPQARPDFTDEWTGYLKDGETPFERFLRERKDVQSVLKLYQRALEENESLKAQQPQASGIDVGALIMLTAAAKSGDIGALELAMQLTGTQPCPACGYVKQHCRCAAQQQAEAVPLTHVLVPVDEPTDEMVDAACAAVDGLCRVDFVRAYVAAFAHLKAGYRDESYWCGWNAAIKFQQAEAVPTAQIVTCDTCKHSANSCDDYPCNRCGVEFGDGPFNRWEAPQQAEAVPSSALNPDESDSVTLWAEIWRLREAVKGPDGYATWQDAATAERIRRVRAESKQAEASALIERMADALRSCSGVPHWPSFQPLINEASKWKAEAVPPSNLIDPGSVVSFAVDRWLAEVSNRPLVNKNRRTLDDTWRQVIRRFGGDPDVLLGPPHDELAAIAQQKGRQQ